MGSLRNLRALGPAVALCSYRIVDDIRRIGVCTVAEEIFAEVVGGRIVFIREIAEGRLKKRHFIISDRVNPLRFFKGKSRQHGRPVGVTVCKRGDPEFAAADYPYARAWRGVEREPEINVLVPSFVVLL